MHPGFATADGTRRARALVRTRAGPEGQERRVGGAWRHGRPQIKGQSNDPDRIDDII